MPSHAPFPLPLFRRLIDNNGHRDDNSGHPDDTDQYSVSSVGTYDTRSSVTTYDDVTTHDDVTTYDDDYRNTSAVGDVNRGNHSSVIDVNHRNPAIIDRTEPQMRQLIDEDSEEEDRPLSKTVSAGSLTSLGITIITND